MALLVFIILFSIYCNQIDCKHSAKHKSKACYFYIQRANYITRITNKKYKKNVKDNKIPYLKFHYIYMHFENQILYPIYFIYFYINNFLINSKIFYKLFSIKCIYLSIKLNLYSYI